MHRYVLVSHMNVKYRSCINFIEVPMKSIAERTSFSILTIKIESLNGLLITKTNVGSS